jgi:crotonobetainyl-CoA:carnitine CoA-transferase CaiB-like acyl-CoA transferase
MHNALEGIRVIDVSQVVAVPVAARHLADFGADVIHVEHPQRGDFWRGYLAGVAGAGAVASPIDYNWEVWNRNKKSLAVDLAAQQGREIMHRLVSTADVFITNLRLWERDKYGLGYEVLSKINPRLIYGSVTGMGKKGPERNLPAYDQTAHWFRSGVVHVLTSAAFPTIGFRAGFGDTVAGMSLFAGIMTALYDREKTGVGQEVEISLMRTGIYQLSFDIAGALVTGRDFKDPVPGAPVPDPNDPLFKRATEITGQLQKLHTELAEMYREAAPNPLAGPYWTKDGRIIHFNILQPDAYWGRVCRFLGRPELEHDPRFATPEARLFNHAEIYHIMRDTLLSRTLDELRPTLAASDLPYAIQQKLSEVINDPQSRANDWFVPFEHPTHGRMEIIGSPLNLSETPASYRLPAPEFSQHTEQVLLDLGYSWDNIGELKQKGVIP